MSVVISFARRRRLFLAAFLSLSSATLCSATDLVWSNPQGTATLYGTGSLVTTLQSSATLDGENTSDSLIYAEATGIPAISQSEVTKGASMFTARSTLSVTESEEFGLPFTEGAIDFSKVGSGTVSGSAAIKLDLLISVPDPTLIQLSSIRSTVTTTGSPAALFSLLLYQSDASGAKIGGPLLSFVGGGWFDATGSYQSSQPYYLLEMNVAGNADSSSLDSVTFSYQLNLATVPEPSSAAFLVAAMLVAVTGVHLRRLRRNNGTER